MTEELERLYLRDVAVMIDALRHTVTALFSEKRHGTEAMLRPAVDSSGLVDKAFRYAHSIKSQADAVGRAGVAEAAHATEDLLSKARSEGVGRISATELQSRVEALREAFRREPELVAQERMGDSAFSPDGPSGTGPSSGVTLGENRPAAVGPSGASAPRGGLAARAAALRGGGAPAAPDQSAAAPDQSAAALPPRVSVSTARQHLTSTVRARVAEAEQRGERAYILSVFLDSASAMPEMRFYLIQTNLERAVAVLRTWTVPPKEGAPTAGHGGDGSRRAAGDGSPSRAAAPAFHAVVTTNRGEEELRRLVSVDEVVRVDVDSIGSEQMMPFEWVGSGERPTPHTHLEAEGSAEEAAERALLAAGELGQVIAAARQVVRDMDSTRERDRDHLLGLLRSAGSFSSRISDDLDEELSTRFGEIARPVAERISEIAQKRGKRVQVQLLGSWTRVPRGLESTLGDVLLQLARNSLDHGIESPKRRSGLGKPPAGTIAFGAERSDRWISIWVDDDGRGIDEALVRKLRPDAPAGNGLLQLVAEPGFTTFEEGSTSSGRGVGLDVVTHTVKTLLLGELELTTTPDQGSRFTAKLPAGARALDVLIVSLGRRRLAVPRMLVDDVRALGPGDLTVAGRGERFVSVDGSYRPLCGTGLTEIPDGEAIGLIVNGTAGRAVLVAERVLAEERVLRYRKDPYQVYWQSLDRSVALLVPLHGC